MKPSHVAWRRRAGRSAPSGAGALVCVSAAPRARATSRDAFLPYHGFDSAGAAAQRGKGRGDSLPGRTPLSDLSLSGICLPLLRTWQLQAKLLSCGSAAATARSCLACWQLLWRPAILYTCLRMSGGPLKL